MGEIVSSAFDSKSGLVTGLQLPPPPLPLPQTASTCASCLLWAPIVRVRGKTSDGAFTIQTAPPPSTIWTIIGWAWIVSGCWRPHDNRDHQLVVKSYLVVVTNNVYNTAMSVDIPRTSQRVSWPTRVSRLYELFKLNIGWQKNQKSTKFDTSTIYPLYVTRGKY